MKTRKYLSASGLFGLVHSGFKKITDHRCASMVKIALPDVLMSAFAMFSLKDSSLLTFDKRRKKKGGSLEQVYGIEQVPCDTQMRSTLDDVDPEEVKPLFKDVFGQIQRGKVLEKFVFMDGYYLLSLDGTGYFSSKKVHCASCLEKKHKTGEVTYYHQMMGGAIVHPDHKEVIPLVPEPIVKQDGETKNDCERNAAKRFLNQFRKDHPHLRVIVLEDSLSPNAPHIRELERHDLRYILSVKEGDHAFLFNYIATAHQKGETTEVEYHGLGGVQHQYRFLNRVPLNKSNQDILVNFVEYRQVKGDEIVKRFRKVTDFTVTTKNVRQIMRGGRAYWKIENETFNTLKNQGYHFEHNYGHGKNNLSVVFALLMVLAFLVDQTQQMACRLFQAVLEKEGSRKDLWEHMRSLFYSLKFNSMEDIYKALLYGYEVKEVVIFDGY